MSKHKLSDAEYLEIVALCFKDFKPCPVHGNIYDEINRIAGRLREIDGQPRHPPTETGRCDSNIN